MKQSSATCIVRNSSFVATPFVMYSKRVQDSQRRVTSRTAERAVLSHLQAVVLCNYSGRSRFCKKRCQPWSTSHASSSFVEQRSFLRRRCILPPFDRRHHRFNRPGLRATQSGKTFNVCDNDRQSQEPSRRGLSNPRALLVRVQSLNYMFLEVVNAFVFVSWSTAQSLGFEPILSNRTTEFRKQKCATEGLLSPMRAGRR
jgi:hypothetical protein